MILSVSCVFVSLQRHLLSLVLRDCTSLLSPTCVIICFVIKPVFFELEFYDEDVISFG